MNNNVTYIDVPGKQGFLQLSNRTISSAIFPVSVGSAFVPTHNEICQAGINHTLLDAELSRITDFDNDIKFLQACLHP
ncbi:hypothetical protein [Serratia ficaria]|uniref:hypothetical protein n=1 Tax=Serratia ficaria TaxID=61651 RepID=UPI0021B7645A|nr:hypothetical protein [Serratia ficaria]